jgi:glycerophosphoryl diester phosphodiesterase
VAGWATPSNLIVESFEQTVLGELKARDVPGRYVFLAETSGAPADLLARDGDAARSYADHLTDQGLARLATEVDGVSVDKALLLRPDLSTTDLVDRAHAVGLLAFTWTLRAENRFLPHSLRRGSAARDPGDWLAEFQLILGTGVDGVFADQPDLAVAARALELGAASAVAPRLEPPCLSS